MNVKRNDSMKRMLEVKTYKHLRWETAVQYNLWLNRLDWMSIIYQKLSCIQSAKQIVIFYTQTWNIDLTISCLPPRDSNMSVFGRPAECLRTKPSTHPSSEERIQQLSKMLFNGALNGWRKKDYIDTKEYIYSSQQLLNCQSIPLVCQKAINNGLILPVLNNLF